MPRTHGTNSEQEMDNTIKRKGTLKRIRADEPEWEWITHGGVQYLWRPEDGALYTAEDLGPWGYRKLSSGVFAVTQKMEPPSIEEHIVAERDELNRATAPSAEEIAAAEKAAKAKYWSDIMKKKVGRSKTDLPFGAPNKFEASKKAREAAATAKTAEKEAKDLTKKMKTLKL